MDQLSIGEFMWWKILTDSDREYYELVIIPAIMAHFQGKYVLVWAFISKALARGCTSPLQLAILWRLDRESSYE
jgi:hypothetical protein